MSHSENNLSRTPRPKGRRLTFAVTVSAPTGMTLPQWQTLIHHAITEALNSNSNVGETDPIIVKLLKSTTTYEAGDE
jgi:hypothetical protein